MINEATPYTEKKKINVPGFNNPRWAKIIGNFNSGMIIYIFIALWELLPRAGIIDPIFLPPASDVGATLLELTLSGVIFDHLFISLQRAALGFGLALIIGIPLGIAIGWYKNFERFVDPLMQMLRNIPTLAVYPVFILFLGIGEISKIAIIFMVTIWKIMINTTSGVKSVDPLLIKSARAMGATSNWDIFKKVVLPSSIPPIVTGVRLGATSAILVLVAAEMLGAKSGLGFLVISSQYNFLISEMYAAIVVLTVLGLVTNYALVWFEKRATKWKEEVIII